MQFNLFVNFNIQKNNMWHTPNKKGICAHIFNVRALDAKQRINFFWPYGNSALGITAGYPG